MRTILESSYLTNLTCANITDGENLFLAIQNVIVTLLIVYHAPTTSGAKNTAGVLAAATATAISAISLMVVPHDLLPVLQLATLPIGLASKIPQIASNARAGSTGNLSAIAVGAQILGCAARLFTTSTELAGDAYVMWGFILAFVLNGIVGLQIWMYWGKDGSETFTKKREEPIALQASAYPREKLEVPEPRAVSPAPRAGSMRPNSPNAAGNRRWTRKVD